MRPVTPFDFFRPAMQATQILLESQMVIWLRLAGMAGLWRMQPEETNRMVAEKVTAGMDAAHAALRVGMAGGSAPKVAMAALTPVRRKTRSNARRLQKSATQSVLKP